MTTTVAERPSRFIEAFSAKAASAKAASELPTGNTLYKIKTHLAFAALMSGLNRKTANACAAFQTDLQAANTAEEKRELIAGMMEKIRDLRLNIAITGIGDKDAAEMYLYAVNAHTKELDKLGDTLIASMTQDTVYAQDAGSLLKEQKELQRFVSKGHGMSASMRQAYAEKIAVMGYIANAVGAVAEGQPVPPKSHENNQEATPAATKQPSIPA